MAFIPTPDQLNTSQQTSDAGAAPMPVPVAQVSPATPSSIQTQAATTLNSTPEQAADAALQLRVDQPASAPMGLFGTKLAQALDKNPIPLKPNGQPVPGGWAKSLIGAAQNVLAGFGDISTEKAPAGAGFLSGFSRAAANRNQRVAAQQEQAHKQQHEDEQDRLEQQRADDEHQEAQANNTLRNIQMMHQQALAHQTGIDSDIERGTRVVKMLEDPDSGHPAPIAAKDVTYKKMQQGVIDGKWNLQDFTPYPTGKIVVGENPQTGDPLYETTYDLVNANGKFKPDDDEIDFLNKNKANEQQIQHGQEFTYSNWGLQHQQAANNSTALEAKKQVLEKQQLIDAKQADELAAVNVRPDVVKALAESNNDPVKAINAVQARAQADPKFAARAGNIVNDFREYYGLDKDGKSYLDQMLQKAQEANSSAATNANYYLNNPDKMSGDNANTAIADAKEHLKNPNLDAQTRQSWGQVLDTALLTNNLNQQDKKNLKKAVDSDYAGNFNLTGDAYLATVPQESRQTIKEIADGQIPLKSLSYVATRNPALLDSVAAYDPNFDGGKIEGYISAIKDYTSGATSKQLESGATALRHMQELKQINDENPELSRIGTKTEAGAAYENKVDTLAGELVKFYGMPNTDNSINSIKDSLNTKFNRDAAIKTQAQSMSDKFDELENKWKNAAPSPAYERPMPYFSDQAKAARAALDPRYQVQPNSTSTNPSAPPPPAPAAPSHIVKDANGKFLGTVVNNKFVPAQGPQ